MKTEKSLGRAWTNFFIVDFLYLKLERDIRTWYSEQHPNQETFVELHVKELHDYYYINPERFKDCEDMEAERAKFLTELQGIVDIKCARVYV